MTHLLGNEIIDRSKSDQTMFTEFSGIVKKSTTTAEKKSKRERTRSGVKTSYDEVIHYWQRLSWMIFQEGSEQVKTVEETTLVGLSVLKILWLEVYLEKRLILLSTAATN